MAWGQLPHIPHIGRIWLPPIPSIGYNVLVYDEASFILYPRHYDFIAHTQISLVTLRPTKRGKIRLIIIGQWHSLGLFEATNSVTMQAGPLVTPAITKRPQQRRWPIIIGPNCTHMVGRNVSLWRISRLSCMYVMCNMNIIGDTPVISTTPNCNT